MKKILSILLLLNSFTLFAQQATISGRVTDAGDNGSLIGVHVIIDSTSGVVTGIDGDYIITVKPGTYKLRLVYVGYVTEEISGTISQGENITRNVKMKIESRMLNDVVVSAGKFEQKISDITVSMELIKAKMLESNSTTSIETALQKVPGVTMLNDQASIRGGSGYSYGAGSRVLLLLDGLPILTGVGGEAKWWVIPIENIEQIEIIKGASSALFGTSALNGAINIRTSWPRNKPQTKLSFTQGFYGNPAREEIKWWGDRQPIFSGLSFFHSRKAGNFDLIFSGNGFSDNSYREGDYEQRARANFNVRYRSKKIEGLSYGISGTVLERRNNSFLLWLNGDTGIYRPSTDYVQQNSNTYYIIDPSVQYIRNKNTIHSLKGRYYSTDNRTITGQDNKDDSYNAEYQFQKRFARELNITTGVTVSHAISNASIYGSSQHFSNSGGIFGQLDKKIKRLTLSLGGRWEAHKLDNDMPESQPVFRSGLNYQLAEYSFLRASYGQGYRYPTIAERYTYTEASAIKVMPNPELKPETGWSAEVGFKQGFKISAWDGYVDVAGFWTEYKDMIEFTFGQHHPDSVNIANYLNFIKWTGFKAYNVSNAQITGFDFTITGEGKLFGLPATLLAGYTYTNPIDMDINRDSLKSTKDNILKYRFYHNAKADIEVSWKKLSGGIGLEYNSFMINIDKAFEDTLRFLDGKPIMKADGTPLMIMPGLHEYRKKNNKGDIVFDLRFAYQMTESSRFSIVIKNILNREYMTRPGYVMPPRNISFQYSLNI